MSYGNRVVLDGVDLAVGRGELVALLGPNGAGKTTTIELLEGFRSRDAGELSVLGVDPARGDEQWRARIGVVLQSWRDHPRWTVRQLLGHMGEFFAPFGAAAMPRPIPTDEVIEMVGLSEKAGSQIRSLSGGQRRRLDVAIGIVGRPEVLFLDEPTAGFDPQARREFHELIHRLVDFEETTILLTTHDLAEAEVLADRIAILDGGRIVASGSSDELARQVAGASEVSWMQDGVRHVHSTGDATAFVRELLGSDGDSVTELRVREQTLEDTYLAMVARRNEAAAQDVGAEEREAAR
ncbi:ABC transporter ATP-binding protein [Salinibacterium sp. dk2585]|uniref:ABC transporter ATP-binding protein n=2 Tax=unclassified Salinibacterium TaxID=2632331 RepID=UPI0011C2536E|nr:ABC transporter ATP-binding protein [Salinibacterium sp. dk2585]QEE62279.1 ABC transporter ATP-binding protein [Salinibacterium sp. dk2585]TXK53708.1 ABC transporter ATP-binding protein [Salinibacterium sp. dk5596]